MKCGICAGCIGMGPCDDELATRDECGKCALEAQHGGPCAWLCHYCQGRTPCPYCEDGLLFDEVEW